MSLLSLLIVLDACLSPLSLMPLTKFSGKIPRTNKCFFSNSSFSWVLNQRINFLKSNSFAPKLVFFIILTMVFIIILQKLKAWENSFSLVLVLNILDQSDGGILSRITMPRPLTEIQIFCLFFYLFQSSNYTCWFFHSPLVYYSTFFVK